MSRLHKELLFSAILVALVENSSPAGKDTPGWQDREFLSGTIIEENTGGRVPKFQTSCSGIGLAERGSGSAVVMRVPQSM